MKIVGSSDRELAQAVSLLRAGGIVAFPTETYYGLAVDPFNEQALTRLFRVKGRPSAKPVLVLVTDQGQIDLLVVEIIPVAVQLMDRFWPGPLTLVLPARSDISPLLTGGTGTVGVRLSPHPTAAALLRGMGGPLTATSANLSGKVPAATAEEVLAAFGGALDLVIDGGRTPGKMASTLVRVSGDQVSCLREGRIAFAEIQQVLGATGG